MKKKIVLLFWGLAGVLTSQAERLQVDETSSGMSYPYLTFETTDGAKVSVPASSLTIQISGTTMTAGGQQFTLTNLKKMYFSTSDESTATGIEATYNVTLDEATEIYDLQGHKVSKAQMQKGVYIIKTKEKTYKIAVR